MKYQIDVYSPRQRALNIELIKNILQANSEDSHRHALRSFTDKLHPSVFAELDWREMSVPNEYKEQAAGMSDGLFLNNLEKIISLRLSQYDLDDIDMFDEILENSSFYEYIFETEPEIADAFGKDLRERIYDLYQSTKGVDVLKNPARYSEVIKNAKEKLTYVNDKENLPLFIYELLSNKIIGALDHISSRTRAKSFIRTSGNKFPKISIGEINSLFQVQRLKEQVEDIREKARDFGLLSLKYCAIGILSYLEDTEILALNQFEGDWATMHAICHECSMMFSTSAIVSLDPTCPFLFEEGPESRALPLEFNIATCPFCGSQKRIEVPSMFHWPAKQKVIYCIPTMEQYSKEEAEEVFAEAITGIRERYKSRITPDEATAFDAASEEVTYNIAHFITSIQMGTTNKVFHDFLTVTLVPSGRTFIADKTTGAIIDLISPSEILQLWPDAPTQKKEEYQQLNLDNLVDEGLTFYSKGQYEQSRQILEEAHKKNPENQLIKRYLKSVYSRMSKRFDENL